MFLSESMILMIPYSGIDSLRISSFRLCLEQYGNPFHPPQPFDLHMGRKFLAHRVHFPTFLHKIPFIIFLWFIFVNQTKIAQKSSPVIGERK